MRSLFARGNRSNANDRSIAAFTTLGHGLFHWFELAVPIFLVVWLREFPATVELLGLVVAVGMAPIGLTALPAGLLVDRFGARPVALLSIGGMAMGFGTLALADSIRHVGLSLTVWGMFAGLYHPAGMSLISTGASRRGTIFAYHGMAGNLGTALGPFVTATLLLVLDWHVVAGVLAVPGFVVLLFGLVVRFDPTAAEEADGEPEPRGSTVDGVRTLLGSSFGIVFLVVALDGLVYRGIITYLPQVLRGLPGFADLGLNAGLVGVHPGDYVFVGLLVVGIAGQYVGGKLTERVPVERALIVGFGALGLITVCFLPFARIGLSAGLLMSALVGFFLFLVQPLYQVAVAVHSPPSTRGLSYGLTYLGEFGIGAASIAVGGYLLGTYPSTVFFAGLGLVSFVAAFLAAFLAQRSGD
ncbi:MAG: MFS transporter [Halodesulfurarchaeum sp.]